VEAGQVSAGLLAGNLAAAVKDWDGCPVMGAYLWWWSGGTVGVDVGDRWDGVLAGRTVELRGPADAVPVDAELLARILRGPEADASCDIGYSNMQFWSDVDRSAPRLAMVAKWPNLPGAEGCRTLWNAESLFADGAANMGPAAMLDLLTGGARVVLTGMTFYAAGRDYVDDEMVNGWESIMSHNPLVNRRVVKNLYDAGVVRAAGVTAEVLSWTDDEYLLALATHRSL
jgi:hypothetical protein